MTENPAQGASPENREPATPNEGAAGRPQAAPAPDSPHGESDPPAGPGRGRPAAAGLPAAPAVLRPPPGPETQQFGAPQVHAQQGTTPGQPTRSTPRDTARRRAPPPSGNPSRAAPSKGLVSTASPLTASRARLRRHPSGSPYASNPAHAPKRKAAFGVPTLVASILAAGLVGGGVVAGTTQLMGDRPSRPPDPATAARPAPSSSTTGRT